MYNCIRECNYALKNLKILDVYRDRSTYDEINDQSKFLKTQDIGWVQAWNRDHNALDEIDDPENHLFIPLIYLGQDTHSSNVFPDTLKYIKDNFKHIYMAGLSRLKPHKKFHKHKDIDEKFDYNGGKMMITNTLLCGEGILNLWKDGENEKPFIYKHKIGESITYEPHIYHSAYNTGDTDRVILMVNNFVY